MYRMFVLGTALLGMGETFKANILYSFGSGVAKSTAKWADHDAQQPLEGRSIYKTLSAISLH